MSDIKIEFSSSELALVALLIGWPGLVVGALAGGLLWRRHPVLGALAGAVLGLPLWVGAKILLR